MNGRMKYLVYLFCLLSVVAIVPAQTSQVGSASVADSVFVFQSPRPLLSEGTANKPKMLSTSGVEVLFSGSGFGFGGFYQRAFGDDFVGFVSAAISGARNSSEFESAYDPDTYQWYVPGKVNRLYMLPVTIGLNMKVLQNELSDNIRPFISAGVSPTFIFSAPYSEDLFTSWSHATSYLRGGVFAGVGTYIGSPNKGSLGVNVRYYFIPFGGNGLESIRDLPMKDFGGLFLSLSIGFGR